MKLFKILWIYLKCILHLPIYRIDILNWTEYFYIGKFVGLCSAIKMAMRKLQIFNEGFDEEIVYYFPKYTMQNAQMFPYNYVGRVFWWEPDTWSISGRLGFFYWLKEQYKDDKTNLRRIK